MRLAHRQQADHQRLTRLDVDRQLLARLRALEKRRRRQHAHVAIFIGVLHVVLEHPRIEQPGEHLLRRSRPADDLGHLLLRRLEVGRRHRRTGTARDDVALADDPLHHLRREAPRRLSHPAGQQIDHRLGKRHVA